VSDGSIWGNNACWIGLVGSNLACGGQSTASPAVRDLGVMMGIDDNKGLRR